MGWKWFLFSFEGRISRKSFWLFSAAVILLFGVVDFASNGRLIFKQNTATTVFTFIVLWPSLAVSVKRWHDRNRSGWWQLINIVPIVGTLWTLVQDGLLQGSQGGNRFGKDPLAGTQRYALTRQVKTKEAIVGAVLFVLLILVLFSWVLIQVFSRTN